MHEVYGLREMLRTPHLVKEMQRLSQRRSVHLTFRQGFEQETAGHCNWDSERSVRQRVAHDRWCDRDHQLGTVAIAMTGRTLQLLFFFKCGRCSL